tara:strand:+ start:130 stop:591 length:462 start_codon:yes stop_codon:yes gene_type:complete
LSLKCNWVLIDELAVGPAPQKNSDLIFLSNIGIKSIFRVCDDHEAPMFDNIDKLFNYRQFVLPDHKAEKLPSVFELQSALTIINELRPFGPIYIHCLAGIERSPLLCMAYLICFNKLPPDQALEYLLQVHPTTNPLPGQFKLLRNKRIDIFSK